MKIVMNLIILKILIKLVKLLNSLRIIKHDI